MGRTESYALVVPCGDPRVEDRVGQHEEELDVRVVHACMGDRQRSGDHLRSDPGIANTLKKRVVPLHDHAVGDYPGEAATAGVGAAIPGGRSMAPPRSLPR